MTTKLILLWCTLVYLLSLHLSYHIGYNSGWAAYAVDSNAMHSYHMQVNRLPDPTNAVARFKLWQEIVIVAQRSQNQWDDLTMWQKYNETPSPYWQRNVGEPRSIAR